MTSYVFSGSNILMVFFCKALRGDMEHFPHRCLYLPSAALNFHSVFCNDPLLLHSPFSLTPVVLFLCSNSSPHPPRNPLPVGLWRPGHSPLTVWSQSGVGDGGPWSSLSLCRLKWGLLSPPILPSCKWCWAKSMQPNSGSIVYSLCHPGEVALPL